MVSFVIDDDHIACAAHIVQDVAGVCFVAHRPFLHYLWAAVRVGGHEVCQFIIRTLACRRPS